MAALDEQGPTAQALNRAVLRLDAWRAAPLARPTPGGSYKEWMHFCVQMPPPAPGHLLINFSVAERSLPLATVRTPRLIVLAHTEAWQGTVEAFADQDVQGEAGQVDLTLGPNSIIWRDGAFLISVHTKEIEAELRVVPLMLPTVASSVSLGETHAMRWVVIPRLETDGWVRFGGQRRRLHRAATYHDHNWGQFRWGGDLSWEWGFLNPTSMTQPWSVVFVRVSDSQRHRTLSQGVLVWKKEVNVRTFQNSEIKLELDGCHVGERPLTLPGIVGLLAPGAASGVPAHLRLRASGVGDELELAFRTQSIARLALPSDAKATGLVLLNEAAGHGRLRGTIGGEHVELDGPAIVEFVRG